MISYCIAVYRPTYARRLIADLVLKTSVRYEILCWLNVADDAFESELAAHAAHGVPLVIVGRTPQNIGMQAYRELFGAARYPLIVQIDDDVVRISHRIAERSASLFDRHRSVRQLVADVWQDELTTGARPPLAHYRTFDRATGLYLGPIDGWFSVYHRSILPLLLSLPYSGYMPIGGLVRARLAARGQHGLLDLGMKVFHVIGPQYAEAFGMLDFEIDKYRRVGRADIVAWYEGWRDTLNREVPNATRLDAIAAAIDAVDGSNPRSARAA